MPSRKRLSPAFCFAAVMVLLGLSGCQTTGSGNTHARETRHGKDKLHGQARQFDPSPRGGATARELSPVSNRGTLELIREANASAVAAAEHRRQGHRDEAAREFRHALNLLAAAELQPWMLYTTDPVLADDLARELKADRRQHHGESPANCMKVPVPVPDRVLAQIARIQNDYPKSFQAALDRGQRYIPEIRTKLRAAGLPEELCYVAMIESHYNEKINSRAGAGGMWQFMPETGRRQGLRLDGYVDGRYDWQASTDAAIKYLTMLHDRFNGNWPLAIASYNAGEGGIGRAVDACGGENEFFRLIETAPASNMIKQETKDYFPKFLAYWLVTEHAREFGFEMNAPSIESTEAVSIRGSYAFDDLEQSMGLPGGTLSCLNPEFVRQVTPPIGDNPITVPAGTSPQLMAALQTVPQYGQGVRAHKVRKGETLASIAGKYGVTQDQLKRENKLKTAKLKPGQSIRLPFAVPANNARGGQDETEPLAVAAKEEKAKRQQAPRTVAYTVKPADTLSKIASTNGIALEDLLAENKLSKKSQIKAGQKLTITKAAAAAAPARGADADDTPRVAAVEHTVVKGEYLAVIARKYGVSIGDLETWNGIEHGETVREGQKLAIRKAGAAASTPATRTAKSAPAKSATVTVERGDTASKIASRAGVSVKELYAWNDLNEKSVLRAGQQLVIAPGTALAASSEPEPAAEPIRLAAKTGAKTAKAAAPAVHTVTPGQTPTSIAKRYGLAVLDLFKLNKWSKDHVLKPGDKVLVAKK